MMIELPRSQWFLASRFLDSTGGQILEGIASRVHSEKGLRHCVLLDLDSTLYEVGPRTYQIMMDWVQARESRSFPRLREFVSSVRLDQIQYSIEDTLKKADFQQFDSVELQAVESIRRFWFDRFFTNDYLSYDRAYPGASEFVQKLVQIGVEITYLTGRDRPNMEEGTLRNLIRDQFPCGPGISIQMKPSFGISDLEFKLEAAASIATAGNLLASFENEPYHVVALLEKFPSAMHVFVDTVCSSRATRPCSGVYRITQW